MKVTLLGTGGAWPDADRSGPATIISHDGKNYLVDCGPGTCQQLMKAKAPLPKIDIILFTHFHIDHCVEFPSLIFSAYLVGKERSFHVFGPKGAKHFTTSIFNDTYNFAKPMIQKLRNKKIEIITKEISKGIFFNQDDLKIEAMPVAHGSETQSLAYRFSAGKKSVVISGDTSPCEELITISKNADLLIVECSFPEDFGRRPGHLTPSDVGKIAQKSKPKKVVLYHLFSPHKGKEKQTLAEIKKYFKGHTEIGHDLKSFLI